MTTLFAVGFIAGYVAMVGLIVFLLELVMPEMINLARATRRALRRGWNWLKKKWPWGSSAPAPTPASTPTPAPTPAPATSPAGQAAYDAGVLPIEELMEALLAQAAAQAANPTVEPVAPVAPKTPAAPKPAKKAGLAGGFQNLELPPEGAEGAV